MIITLVEPNTGYKGSIYTHAGSVLEPIGIEYIGAYVSKKLGYDVILLSQGETSTEEFVRTILNTKPDIVGFSVFTYNFPLSRDIANKLKDINPSIIIVFGGYHPTAKPEITSEKCIDFVISGEGEIKFAKLVKAIENKKDLNALPTNVPKELYNSGNEYIEDIDSLPFPLRTTEILNKCKLYGMYYPSSRNQICPAQVVYSRGCPHNCKYCASSSMWGNKVRWRSASNVVEELKLLIQRYGTNLIFFCDLIFNLSKKKVLELCKLIISEKLEINWFSACKPDCIDEELLDYMILAGCKKIHYGIESLVEKNLVEVGRNNLSKNINRILKMTHDKGIITRGYLMLGYPGDNQTTLEETTRKVKYLFLDDLRISFYTPLPGTELYKNAYTEGNLLTYDFSLYNTDEPVLRNQALTRDELIEARHKILKEFYFSREYKQRKKEKLKIVPFLKESYDELFDCLNNNNIK